MHNNLGHGGVEWLEGGLASGLVVLNSEQAGSLAFVSRYHRQRQIHVSYKTCVCGFECVNSVWIESLKPDFSRFADLAKNEEFKQICWQNSNVGYSNLSNVIDINLRSLPGGWDWHWCGAWAGLEVNHLRGWQFCWQNSKVGFSNLHLSWSWG